MSLLLDGGEQLVDLGLEPLEVGREVVEALVGTEALAERALEGGLDGLVVDVLELDFGLRSHVVLYFLRGRVGQNAPRRGVVVAGGPDRDVNVMGVSVGARVGAP